MTRDLAFRGVALRDREPRRRTELVGDRLYPLHELLDARTGADRLPALEVDQLAREPEADRAPQILLEQPVRPRGQRLALVERARDSRRERIDERDERARLGDLGLRIADANLDGRKLEVRSDAPPKLCVLGDRPGLVREREILLPGLPPPE